MLVALEEQTCSKCGIVFGAPATWWQQKRESKDTFYCPNGHPRVFREGAVDQLRRERDLLKQQLAQKDDSIKYQREQREAAERREAAAKGQITKLKKRANAGVCPCCNRTFLALQRHMAQKHPTFLAEEAPKLKVVPK